MAKRVADIIRDPITGAPVNNIAVTVKRVSDNSTIASTTTGADGKAEFSETQIEYPGPLYYSATDGTTTRQLAGYSTGQIGTWFASDFVRAMRIMTDGVVKNIDGELAVTATGSDMVLSIANGFAFLYGHSYYQPGTKTVTVAANGAGNARIDLVVLRLSPPGTSEEGKIVPAIVQGTPAATPSAPTPTQNAGTVWEIPLRTVLVDPGVSAIVTGKLTDARVWSSGPLMDGTVTTAKLADLAATREKISMNAIILNRMDAEGNLSTAAAAKVYKAPTSGNTPVIGTLNLSELNDVDETVATDGQVVTWDAASSKYKPRTPASVQIVVQEGDTTKVAAANTLDFDATDFDVTESPAGEANIAIAADSITATEIAAGAVGSSELAAGAVIAGKLGAASVGNTELSNGAVDSAKLAVDAVLTSRIANAQVTGAKIAATTITAANIAADTITANELAANAVGASELADNAVDTAAIAANAVTLAKLSRSGSSGQVLTSNGAGSDPTYQTLAVAVSHPTSVRQNVMRDEVASGYANVTSTTGQVIAGLWADITLPNGAVYDVLVTGGASVTAPGADYIYTGAIIDALGGSPTISQFNGEGTSTGSKYHGATLAFGVTGNGGAVRCGLWFKVGSGTGSVGSGSVTILALPRASS